jgi:hypothetical protein
VNALKKPTFNDSIRDRILKYLDKCQPAVSGRQGHDQTFKVAVVLVWGFYLPRHEALEYLRGYNERCLPLWTETELVHKINSAIETCNRQWAAGIKIKPPGYLRCYWRSSNKEKPLDETALAAIFKGGTITMKRSKAFKALMELTGRKRSVCYNALDPENGKFQKRLKLEGGLLSYIP